jgi:hypothetical protein
MDVTFKKIVLELDDAKFQAVVMETLDAIKQRITDARAAFKTAKAANVAGLPSLEQKGVSISVGVSF